MLHATLIALSFIEQESWAIKVDTLREYECSVFFVPVNLTLTRWPLYTILTDTYWRWKYELPTSVLSKVIVWQTYIHTERQTDRHNQNYITQLRGWSTTARSCCSLPNSNVSLCNVTYNSELRHDEVFNVCLLTFKRLLRVRPYHQCALL